MLLEEGLQNVFARHDRFAEATRRAVRTWGLEVQCADPLHYSSSLTAVRLARGPQRRRPACTILEKYNMSLGNGLGILKDRVFRIGHLGDFGDLQLIGTLGGVEMGLRVAACRTRRAVRRRRSIICPGMRDASKRTCAPRPALNPGRRIRIWPR